MLQGRISRYSEKLREVKWMFQADLLQNKVILVTGGGTGLGRAMGERFLELGAKLAICGRRQEVAEQAAAEIALSTDGETFATRCDVRHADQVEAMMDAVIARIGLVPDGGGGYTLPRLIGLGRALEMALLADEVSGPEAERIGLVNRCVPLVEFEETTRALAKRLATGPTRTYGLIKELMYKSLDMDLQATLHLEGQLQEAAYATADHRESVGAFLHKRAAKFTGI
jgi:1,4-dihydroxy-2-naphthoyl-CoA synthase